MLEKSIIKSWKFQDERFNYLLGFPSASPALTLREHFADHVAVHIRQASIDPIMQISQSGVVHAHQV